MASSSVIVRYADGFVMWFEKKADAEAMLLAVKERLAGFGLALNEDKTRLIEFGRFIVEHKTEGKRLKCKLTALGMTLPPRGYPFCEVESVL
jgi:hypothetical protein